MICQVGIDCFSRFAFGKLLKDKSAKTVLEKYDEIISSLKKKPKKVQTDLGKEFNNRQELSKVLTFLKRK